MIIPPYLEKGSTIAICATARYADKAEVELSKRLLEEQGFHIVVAPNVSKADNRFAGNDIERLKAFQDLLDDPKINAIWLARGGYGTLRIIDKIDWTKFIQSPKWLIGFSDFTLVHVKLEQMGIASLHACTFVQVQKTGISNENVISVIEALFNQSSNINFIGSEFNREGSAEGRITGGNLSLISNSIGTSTQLNTKDCILMLEDCDEYLYHFDRMLWQLKRAGLLKDIKALIIGESRIKPEPDDIDFGYSLEEIVLNICEEYSFPICFHAPFGHTEKNYALRFNLTMSLEVSKNAVILRDAETSYH